MTDLKPIVLWGLVGLIIELSAGFWFITRFWGDAEWVLP